MAKTQPSKGKPNQQRRSANRTKPTTSKGNVRTPFAEGKLSNKGRDNDPNWYFTSPTLAQQASELSFQAFLGQTQVLQNYDVPTVGVIALNPCPGISYGNIGINSASYSADLPALPDDTESDGMNSGINLMSTKIYTLLSTYSGRTQAYQPDDVGIMILAIASLAELSEHIRRAFGLAMTYNERNRAVPKGLLKAMGINFDDLVQNLANYRMRFNIAMSRINQIPLLDNIGFIRKSREIYQKVYTDDYSSMAQLYVYVPSTVWRLDETSWDQGSRLETVEVYNAVPGGTAAEKYYAVAVNRTSAKTMDQLLDIMEDQIDRLLNSSTLNIVYADLLNVASKINVPMWHFDYLAENYGVIPEYNRNFLLQLHNLDIIGAPFSYGAVAPKYVRDIQGYHFTTSNDVYGNAETGRVIYNPTFVYLRDYVVEGEHRYWGTNVPYGLVDMDTDQPTVEDRIEALRFKSLPSGYFAAAKSGEYREAFRALPDHYAVSLTIFTPKKNYTFFMSTRWYDITGDADITPQVCGMLSQFDHHPSITRQEYSIADHWTTPVGLELYTNLEFWTEIDYKYLARLNKLIYTGLFDFRLGSGS